MPRRDGAREHLGDDGRVGEHGADGELAAATNTNAKVCVEGSFEKGAPIEMRARSVELAFEDSVWSLHERQDVRREVLGEAARRQRSGREEGDVESEGRATVARFARRPRRRRRRRRGDRRIVGGELLGLALARVRSRRRARHGPRRTDASSPRSRRPIMWILRRRCARSSPTCAGITPMRRVRYSTASVYADMSWTCIGVSASSGHWCAGLSRSRAQRRAGLIGGVRTRFALLRGLRIEDRIDDQFDHRPGPPSPCKEVP